MPDCERAEDCEADTVKYGKLRVAMITSYEVSGGAGVAAHRLWQGLRALPDVEVRRFVEHRELPDSDAMHFGEPGKGRSAMRDIAGWTGLRTRPAWRRWEQGRNLSALLKHLRWTSPDIINLHGFNMWTIPGLARAAIPQLAEIAPVVWTLHDIWPLTGKEDYPDLSGGEAALVARGADSADGRALRQLKDRLVWIGPSRWITRLAELGYGADNPCKQIPYGVDTELFSPMSRSAAREVWSIRNESAVMTAVSFRLHDPRKGIQSLLDAAGRLKSPPQIILAGMADGRIVIPRGLNVDVIGPIHDPRLLRTLLAASDFIAVPSVVDNLPNVILESLSCGIPVAGSRIGGIPDLVVDGETGWLAGAVDGHEWTSVINRALADVSHEASAWQSRCRSFAEQHLALHVQAKEYHDVFKKVLAE